MKRGDNGESKREKGERMKEPWGDGVKTLTNTHTPGLD